MSRKTALALVLGSIVASGCALEPNGQGTETLSDLVVPDPDFTFATSRSVRLELQPSGAVEGGQAVEVTDVEGRRILKGAVLGDTVVDLPLSTAHGRELKIRTGREAAEQTVTVGADGRAVASF